MKSILFSIIIPTYNRGHLLLKSIESIIDQIEQDFELIIVDDGSTDDTENIVLPVLNNKIRYFKIANKERGAARNYGVNQAKGKYVTFLDSDDFLYTNHFSVAKEFIQQNPNVEIFHSGYEIKDDSGKTQVQVSGIQNVNLALLKGNPLSCIGVFIKAEIAREFPFKEERSLAGTEDWELWMRIACHHKIISLTQITACMRQHEARSVNNFNSQDLINRIDKALFYIFSYQPYILKYGKFKSVTFAHLNMYISLHLMMNGNMFKAIKYWWVSIVKRPILVFSRKTMGIFKVMIMNLLFK